MAAARCLAAISLLHLAVLLCRTERVELRPPAPVESASPTVVEATEVRTPRRRVGRRRFFSAAAFLVAAAGATGAQAKELTLLEQLDRNADGEVDKQEFMKLLPKGADRQLRSLYNSIFEAADVNGDGVLNEAEVEYSECLAREATRARALKLPKNADIFGRRAKIFFVRADLDGDKLLTFHEFRMFLRTLERDLGDKGLEKQAALLFRHADVNRDKRLDVREFDMALCALAVDLSELRGQELEKLGLFKDFDLSADGWINEREFDLGIQRMQANSKKKADHLRKYLKSYRFRDYIEGADENVERPRRGRDESDDQWLERIRKYFVQWWMRELEP